MSESLNIKINKNLNNKNMSIIGSALKELKSVGSCIDIDLGIVYPLNEDGTPDWDLPIELLDDEVSAEWIAALSDEDYEICKEFIEA